MPKRGFSPSLEPIVAEIGRSEAVESPLTQKRPLPKGIGRVQFAPSTGLPLWQPDPRKLQLELAEWLEGFDFQVWATWTFGKAWPEGPTLEAVRYHVGNWISSQDLRPAFYCAERGTSGQRRWHAHGLLGGHGPMHLEADRRSLWSDWHKRFGRCSFEGLQEQGGCLAYVSKYCFKGLPTQWWISEDATW